MLKREEPQFDPFYDLAIEARAAEPNVRLHRILARPSSTWTQIEAAYVAKVERDAGLIDEWSASTTQGEA